MNNSGYYVILILLLTFLQACYKEVVVFDMEPNSNFELPTILKLNGKDCVFDYKQKTLRYAIPIDSIFNYSPFVEIQDNSVVKFDSIRICNNQINDLGTVLINKEYLVSICTNEIKKQFSLIFTNLPIVQVITPNEIYDEPKMLARLVINYPAVTKGSFNSLVGIEIRGASCQHYRKKSYGLNLLNSMDLDDKVSIPLFDMRSNESWILDAMYIDAARLRNKVSFELWNDMKAADAHKGIKSEFVELYINNIHQGLYCFNENINAELLQLSGSDGLLYKAVAWADGATQFENCSSEMSNNEYWDGWEQKHPSPKDFLNWYPLKELRDFVVNSSDDEFIEEVNNHIDIESFMDYYIFLNLISAMDNTGKNIFITRRDQSSPFSIIPWDMDGAWGISWDGSKSGYTSILSNNIFNRLMDTNPDKYVTKLKNRWSYLRSNNFSTQNLKFAFSTNFNSLNKTDIIEIENSIWNTSIDITEEKEYIESWVNKRLEFLDNYYDGL